MILWRNDSGFPVDVIYLDFQKAFDKVLHFRFVSKLEAHDITANVLVVDWLYGRKQRAVIISVLSQWIDNTKSGPTAMKLVQTDITGINSFVRKKNVIEMYRILNDVIVFHEKNFSGLIWLD